jgi:hypothetical protein
MISQKEFNDNAYFAIFTDKMATVLSQTNVPTDNLHFVAPFALTNVEMARDAGINLFMMLIFAFRARSNQKWIISL